MNWIYEDNVDTDVIIPARYLNTKDAGELALHCMEDIDKDFSKNVKKDDFIIAGYNFGCGSSREHARLQLKLRGLKRSLLKLLQGYFTEMQSI